MAETLSVRDLCVTLANKAVLSEINFTVPPGELFGVLGPNGAGKTTLLRAIAGLVPYRGDVRYAAQSLAALEAPARARLLALVPQRSQLNAPLSAYDVVAQGRYCHHQGLSGLTAEDRSAVEAALHTTSLAELRAAPFTQLSGGEQRRVLLARALATQAPLILLDEPAASLDVAHALTLFQHVQHLSREGRTVIVVLHDLNDARTWCTSLLLLSQGRSVACGSANEVITPQHIRQVYGVELTEVSALGYAQPGGKP